MIGERIEEVDGWLDGWISVEIESRKGNLTKIVYNNYRIDKNRINSQEGSLKKNYFIFVFIGFKI